MWERITAKMRTRKTPNIDTFYTVNRLKDQVRRILN